MFAAAAREVRSLLFWCVLAASTIGPGTVVVCSKAGADFGLELLWALLAASFVAYTLQVNAARLCIVTGLPLGQANEAFALIEGRKTTGKVVFVP